MAREEKGLEGGKGLEKERDWRRRGLEKERSWRRETGEGKVLRARSSAWGFVRVPELPSVAQERRIGS